MLVPHPWYWLIAACRRLAAMTCFPTKCNALLPTTPTHGQMTNSLKKKGNKMSKFFEIWVMNFS